MRTIKTVRLALGAVLFLVLSYSQAAAATNITACGTFGAGSYVVTNNISSAGTNCLIFTAGPVKLTAEALAKRIDLSLLWNEQLQAIDRPTQVRSL